MIDEVQLEEPPLFSAAAVSAPGLDAIHLTEPTRSISMSGRRKLQCQAKARSLQTHSPAYGRLRKHAGECLVAIPPAPPQLANFLSEGSSRPGWCCKYASPRHSVENFSGLTWPARATDLGLRIINTVPGSFRWLIFPTLPQLPRVSPEAASVVHAAEPDGRVLTFRPIVPHQTISRGFARTSFSL